jgi:hypothetical protein
MLPPASGLKSKPINKPAGRRQQAILRVGFLLGLLFNPENADFMFLRNVG